MKHYSPVVWFEIYVNNINRVQKFYEEVFKIELEALPAPAGSTDELEMIAFPMEKDGEGASGALVRREGTMATGNSTVVYFHSADCANEEKRIEAAGGKVLQSKLSIAPYGNIVLASDPEGNIFGIHSIV